MSVVAWLRCLLAAVAIAAALGGQDADRAAAQAPVEDRWSGRWEVTFTTEGDGRERVAGPLCCVVVTPLTQERGRALVSGTTGVPGDNVFTDVVCAGAAARL